MGIRPTNPENICFQDLRTTLELLEGIISVMISGSSEILQGRLFRVDEGKLILVGVFGTRIIPICTISSIDYGPFAYVTNINDDTVSVINTATNTVIGLIPVGGFPREIAITPDGSRAYTANQDDTVSVIDTDTNTVIQTISLPIGSIPFGIAITPDGFRAYTADGPSDDTVSVIDLTVTPNTVIQTITLAPDGFSPVGIAITPDGSRAYTANSNGTVSVIDTATNTVIGSPISVGDGPSGIAITPITI